jgi:hypothetical protein
MESNEASGHYHFVWKLDDGQTVEIVKEVLLSELTNIEIGKKYLLHRTD